jgi:hypothetical protein
MSRAASGSTALEYRPTETLALLFAGCLAPRCLSRPCRPASPPKWRKTGAFPVTRGKFGERRTVCWRELDSNLQFRARAVSVLPLRDQMLASSSSSGEPGESPFSRPGHFREAADNYDCTGRGQPAPHTSSPDRRMAISRGGSYAQTTPRTSTSPTPITRPRRGEGAAAT